MNFDEWDEEEKRDTLFLSESDIEDFEERLAEGLPRDIVSLVDNHKATAVKIFNIPLEQVDQEQRRYAQARNFGLIYNLKKKESIK